MNKEEALEEFLTGFKKSLNISSLYSKEHLCFLKSVEDLKEKTDNLLRFLSPIKIGITPSFLMIDGKNYEKKALYEEIANMLHNRKIKSIEIKTDVTLKELISIMGTISLRPKEIFRSGGIGKIIEKEKTMNLSVEELSYSQFLKDEGEEAKDIWVYLLQEAVVEESPQKISILADNFKRVVTKFKIKDFLEDEQLHKNINNFLVYLKNNQKDKFSKCSQEMFKSILKDKDFSQYDNLDKIKIFLKDLSGDDLANALSEQLSTDASFDALNLKLFSRLIDEKSHQEVASSLAEKLKDQESSRNMHLVRKKVKELFFTSDSKSVSEIYRHTLSFLLENISFESKFYFDRDLLNINYRFILLNLLAQEKDKTRISLILDRISVEWEGVIQCKDWEYLKYLTGILEKIKDDNPSLVQIFVDLDKLVSGFIEDVIWGEDVPMDLRYLIDYSQVSSKGVDYYLNKIFNEGKINPQVLKLFFKFFPNELTRFYENLERKRSDMIFMGKVIESLKLVEYSISMNIYKHIFSVANELMKIEALRAMQDLPDYDAEFLFSIIRGKDALLKKEALVVLMRNDMHKKKAIEILLSIRSPLGIKNRIIFENIRIIEEVGLKEARDYLIPISKNPFFWNRDIKREAQEILGKWDARKD